MDTLLEDMNLYMHLGHTLIINHKIFFTVKKKICLLSTQLIYMFCVDLSTNSSYFHM